MFKLVAVAGPNRGTSFVLKEGELSIGRQEGNTVVLPSSKVSKQHCSVTLSGEDIVVKDLGSSNGTFVNGALIKEKKLKPGDKISVGQYVLELVRPIEKPRALPPNLAGFGNLITLPESQAKAFPPSSIRQPMVDPLHQNTLSERPKDLKSKIIWIFEHEFMPIFYSMNLKYQWKSLCIVLISVFMIGNLTVSVYPLLESSRVTTVRETARRATFMAKQIADQNASYLASRMETKTDVSFIENAEGVRLALLIDLDNRIIAPGAKLNQYLASGSEAIEAVNAKNLFREGRERGLWKEVDESSVVAIEPVKVMNPAVGRNVVVAMAIVSLDTSMATLDLGEMGVVYAQTLILTGLLGMIIFVILYRLTLKPFQTLNEDMDKALKGDITQVTHQFKFEEMNSLWDIINSAIQRIPQRNSLSGGSSGMNGDFGMGGPSPEEMVAEYIESVKMLGGMCSFGVVLFDSTQKIVFLNSAFEEMSGIRSEGALGQEMSSVARDQSMAAFTNDILGRVTPGGGGVSEDYDFSGITYKIHVGAFGSLGSSIKGYLFLVNKAES